MFDDIGNRMKDNYERSYSYKLPPRVPVIIRVDGKAFHSYTKGLDRPWDERLITAMDSVGIQLCHYIDGAQLAYIQSDEISILIHNYKRLNTCPWFGNSIQKMVSVSAAIASSHLTLRSVSIFGEHREALFDSRVFILPEAEVNNYFLWRQLDATRNAIQSLARSKFSHKECDHKSTNELQEMLWQEHNINFNDIDIRHKRGRCVIKGSQLNALHKDARTNWCIDNEIPRFNEDPNYIEKYLEVINE
jgi:tRNA(His) guanylyltransferase